MLTDIDLACDRPGENVAKATAAAIFAATIALLLQHIGALDTMRHDFGSDEWRLVY